MPLFSIAESKLSLVKPTEFALERDLQRLVESNLDVMFDCRLVATEFSTGAYHGGRIDTLALSEDGNPTIIEYKKVESSDLINQSLFYLSWLDDHRGDFRVAAESRLGKDVEIDWSDIRVICIAPGYKKYDLHAVQQMGANIELWRYRRYANSTLLIEEVFRREVAASSRGAADKDSVMVAAGKKAAESRQNGSYTFDQHVDGKPEPIRLIATGVRELCLSLSDAVEESPKKFYVAYKVAKNLLCMVVQKGAVVLYLRLNPADFQPLPTFARDMRETEHYGTGDLELTLKSEDDLKLAESFVRAAFLATGG